jgi:hypothetical protein
MTALLPPACPRLSDPRALGRSGPALATSRGQAPSMMPIPLWHPHDAFTGVSCIALSDTQHAWKRVHVRSVSGSGAVTAGA